MAVFALPRQVARPQERPLGQEQKDPADGQILAIDGYRLYKGMSHGNAHPSLTVQLRRGCSASALSERAERIAALGGACNWAAARPQVFTPQGEDAWADALGAFLRVLDYLLFQGDIRLQDRPRLLKLASADQAAESPSLISVPMAPSRLIGASSRPTNDDCATSA